jgi:hypothetical protein
MGIIMHEVLEATSNLKTIAKEIGISGSEQELIEKCLYNKDKSKYDS